MRIARVETAPFRPAFNGGGFAVSYGRLHRLDHRLVRLTLEDGRTGIGEILRQPATDTTAAFTCEDRALPGLQGLRLGDLPAAISGFAAEGDDSRGLCMGLETAFYDLVGRVADLPVSALLGGSGTGDVPALLGLSCETPDEMAAEIRAHGGDHQMIQIKLGTGTLAQDLERLDAVLPLIAPGQTLLADFNGILNVDEALAVLPTIDHPCLMWEEPCRTLTENTRVARAVPRPVLFDQCVNSLSAVMTALSDGAAAAIAAKPFYLGGLTVARTARDLSAAAGRPMRIDGPWCGQIGSAAALHVAVGAPPDLLMFSGDLTGPLDAGNAMMCHPVPGRVGPVAGAGLGPVPETAWTEGQV